MTYSSECLCQKRKADDYYDLTKCNGPLAGYKTPHQDDLSNCYAYSLATVISGFAGTKCETDPESKGMQVRAKADPSANQISITAGLAKKAKSPKFTDRLGSRSELAALDKGLEKMSEN